MASISKDKLKNKEATSSAVQKKQQKSEKNKLSDCYFVKNLELMKRDFTKYNVWRVMIHQCGEMAISRHTWWINYGAPAHISVSIQGS